MRNSMSHLKGDSKIFLNLSRDEADVVEIERLRCILFEQFDATEVTLENYEKVLRDLDKKGVEISLILLAYGADDTYNYGKKSDKPAPSMFDEANANTKLMPPIWGLYSSHTQSEESFVISRSDFMDKLSTDRMNNLVIYPCVSKETTFAAGGFYQHVKWEKLKYSIDDTTVFLLHLNGVLTGKSRIRSYRSVGDESYLEQSMLQRDRNNDLLFSGVLVGDVPLPIPIPIAKSDDCSQEFEEEKIEPKIIPTKVTTPRTTKIENNINDVKDIKNEKNEKSAATVIEDRNEIKNENKNENKKENRNEKRTISDRTSTNPSPAHNFKSSKKYYLNLINDGPNPEIEKIRETVIGKYGATEITAENYGNILKGKDGQGEDCSLILIAYGDDDTQNYGKAEDSVTFCGCANTGYISPIFGLYSKESQDKESLLITRDDLISELSENRVGRLVIYPCVSDDSSYEYHGHYDYGHHDNIKKKHGNSDDKNENENAIGHRNAHQNVVWEKINYNPNNSNLFLLYLSNLARDRKKERKVIENEEGEMIEKNERKRKEGEGKRSAEKKGRKEGGKGREEVENVRAEKVDLHNKENEISNVRENVKNGGYVYENKNENEIFTEMNTKHETEKNEYTKLVEGEKTEKITEINEIESSVGEDEGREREGEREGERDAEYVGEIEVYQDVGEREEGEGEGEGGELDDTDYDNGNKENNDDNYNNKYGDLVDFHYSLDDGDNNDGDSTYSDFHTPYLSEKREKQVKEALSDNNTVGTENTELPRKMERKKSEVSQRNINEKKGFFGKLFGCKFQKHSLKKVEKNNSV